MLTLGEILPLGDFPTSPVKEAPPHDELTEEHKTDAWFTEASATYRATGQRQWRAVAYAPVSGTILWQTGVQAFSQWAELITAPLAILEGKARYLYTDTWVVYKNLKMWLPRWAQEGGTYKNTLYGGRYTATSLAIYTKVFFKRKICLSSSKR